MSRAPWASSSTRSISSPHASVSRASFALDQLSGHLTPRRSSTGRAGSTLMATKGNGRRGRDRQTVSGEVVEPGADRDLFFFNDAAPAGVHALPPRDLVPV